MSFQIIAVTNRLLCPEPLPQRVASLCAAGVDRVIIREKDLSERAYETVLEDTLIAVDELDHHYRALITVNTFVDIAVRHGIASIQIPFEEFIAHPDFVKEFAQVGVSVHGLAEAKRVHDEQAGFLIAGHIFATDCKPGVEPRGLDFLRGICSTSGLPVYAIGGINESTIAGAKEAGAAGACLMSELMTCEDPVATVQKLRSIVG